MTIRLQYIGEDPVLEAGASYPSFDPLRIRSHGDRLSGTILLPGGVKGELHPCAILLQGYPGYTVTYDIGQALRRAGIVAVNVLYRGCCGSEGEYSFHGMIEDAIQVATWLHEPNVYERYDIDPTQIFFVGHSMGGFTAINAMRRLPWIRGTAVMSPYDLPGALESMGEESVQNLLHEGAEVLHCKGPDALFADALYWSRRRLWHRPGLRRPERQKSLFRRCHTRHNCAGRAHDRAPLAAAGQPSDSCKPAVRYGRNKPRL
ncbi:S9 family peptidase [uncultured Megasphaera sp.]|uniref:alpha/beta hydrolase family protein n=1 Tax=uncultured Megasphaera sp. TaxID=165188 RepID=UPI00259862F0|nr:alpha/beta fold hydrolase [uncultured Megasphaera sp.]